MQTGPHSETRASSPEVGTLGAQLRDTRPKRKRSSLLLAVVAVMVLVVMRVVVARRVMIVRYAMHVIIVIGIIVAPVVIFVIVARVVNATCVIIVRSHSGSIHSG